MKLANLLVLFVILIFSLSAYAYADDKRKTFMTVKCEISSDLIKIAETFVTLRGNEANEMIFLLSPQKTSTDNAVDDSIGYFVHNKDDPGSLFLLVLWLEDEKSCLVLDGFVRRQNDPIKFFEKRHKILEIIKGTEEN